MHGARPTVVGFLLMLAVLGPALAAQQTPPASAPQVPPGAPPQAPAGQGPPGQTPPGQTTPPGQPPAAQVPAQPRTFTAPAGLLFNTVRADRVSDFEKVMGYLQAAFEKSTDEQVRAQARGWRVFKATEPGPSSTVLYVFVLEPTVPGADYGLGRILAAAYPEQELKEIWRLYTGAVTGGSLLNLTPAQAPVPTAKPAP